MVWLGVRLNIKTSEASQLGARSCQFKVSAYIKYAQTELLAFVRARAAARDNHAWY